MRDGESSKSWWKAFLSQSEDSDPKSSAMETLQGLTKGWCHLFESYIFKASVWLLSEETEEVQG